MDLVTVLQSVSGYLPDLNTSLWIGAILILALLFTRSQFGKRVGEHVQDLIFNNWRLALLGLTGVVLSIASGWTTWDGMRNFTHEPLLSFMITFGIQGVMLIVAWLIGESFATGMNFRPHHRLKGSTAVGAGALQQLASSVAGILLFCAIAIVVYSYFATPSVEDGSAGTAERVVAWWDELAIAAPIVLLVVLLIVNAGSDVLEDYVQSLRIMIRSAVLWLMFLACMAASVFFSFDSLFSTIFPKDDRARAAELRAQNQVAGLVADVGALTAREQLREKERLFQTDAWQRFDQDLDLLTRIVAGSEKKLSAVLEKRALQQRNILDRFQEEKAGAEKQQINLRQRKDLLKGEVVRLKERVEQLTPEVQRLKTEIFAKDREIIAKTAEAEAEAGGIGVTSKAGRGPKFREISGQLNRLVEEKKNLELQMSEINKRLSDARQQIAAGMSEISRIDGEIAELQKRFETTTQLIETRTNSVADVTAFDAQAALKRLTSARETFGREPTVQSLAQLQNVCSGLVSVMGGEPTLRRQSSVIDCNSASATKAAGGVFALNAGISALQTTCIGGDKLPKTGGADALFAFARRCVQDSGLSSAATEPLRVRINRIELNRDDKAHRFVVTSNAFGDGNKLAYLALAIAIAIDALVFMSGLFGANAVRSPLAQVPSDVARNPRDIERAIRSDLAPDHANNAARVLADFQGLPKSYQENLGPGWTHQVMKVGDTAGIQPHTDRVMQTGLSFNLVTSSHDMPDRYAVRRELQEYLGALASGASFSRVTGMKIGDRPHEDIEARWLQLKDDLIGAYTPHVSHWASRLMSLLRPISDDNGFTSEVRISDVEAKHPDDVQPLLTAMTIGLKYKLVEQIGEAHGQDRFRVHGDFYSVLVRLRQEHLSLDQPLPAPIAAAPQSSDAHQSSHAAEASAPAATEQPRRPDTSREQSAFRSELRPDNLSDKDLQNYYLNQIIEPLKIETASYFSLDRSAFQLATQASQSFREKCQKKSRLVSTLKEWDTRIRETIDGEIQSLTSNLEPDDERSRDLLAKARTEIDANWWILMLLPNGPYQGLFDRLIQEYEDDNGSGTLDADGKRLLDIAKQFREQISSNANDARPAWVAMNDELRALDSSMSRRDVVTRLKQQSA